jgi:hypothetical protein
MIAIKAGVVQDLVDGAESIVCVEPFWIGEVQSVSVEENTCAVIWYV